jgi:hypothetical protein
MSLTFGLLVFPGVTQLDLTGPFEVVHRVPGAKVHVLWKTLDPVHADSGLGLLPTTTFADCPPARRAARPRGRGAGAAHGRRGGLGLLARKGGDRALRDGRMHGRAGARRRGAIARVRGRDPLGVHALPRGLRGHAARGSGRRRSRSHHRGWRDRRDRHRAPHRRRGRLTRRGAHDRARPRVRPRAPRFGCGHPPAAPRRPWSPPHAPPSRPSSPSEACASPRPPRRYAEPRAPWSLHHAHIGPRARRLRLLDPRPRRRDRVPARLAHGHGQARGQQLLGHGGRRLAVLGEALPGARELRREPAGLRGHRDRGAPLGSRGGGRPDSTPGSSRRGSRSRPYTSPRRALAPSRSGSCSSRCSSGVWPCASRGSCSPKCPYLWNIHETQVRARFPSPPGLRTIPPMEWETPSLTMSPLSPPTLVLRSRTAPGAPGQPRMRRLAPCLADRTAAERRHQDGDRTAADDGHPAPSRREHDP